MNSTDDDPLLTLFRTELRDAGAIIGRGLVSLDANPHDESAVEAIVEAVRTLRGAARLIGAQPVVEMLAALEEYLGAVSSTQPDSLLPVHRATALLAGLEVTEPASWAESTATERSTLFDQPRGQSLPEITPPRAQAPESPPELEVEVPHLIIDLGMLELFREEVRSHAGVLSAELLELERDPANTQRIEPLMRAAHSLKGACRIIGLDAAVGLAHDMEDVFVAAQSGKLRLTPSGIDVFLAATDCLAALGTHDPNSWVRQKAAKVHELRTAIAAIRIAEPAASAAGASPAPAAPPPITQAPTTSTPVASTSVAAPPVADTPGSPAAAPEAVVRVTAESLTRLMSLAGESLVQARWLQPFASALLELKKVQGQIAARLDLAAQTTTDPTVHENLAEARRLTKRSQQVLADRIGEFENHAGQAEDLNSRLYREVIVSRMRPFADGTHGFPRLVRDTARQLGKQVRLAIAGKDTEVDRDILEKLEAPLTHILRNAVDHGIEAPETRVAGGKPAEGVIRLEARHRGGMLSITIADDGGGIDVEKLRKKVTERGHATPAMAARMSDAELLEFLFLPGFSTASQVTEISGRGVGLDVVQDTARKVGGTVTISTTLGKGTTFHLMLPLTLSVVRAVLVEVAGDPYAFPHNRIDRLLRVPTSELQSLQHRQFISVDGKSVGLVLASQLFDVLVQAPPSSGEIPLVLLSDATGTYGLIVDAIRGEQDLVVRPLDSRLGKVPNVSAAAILDDGSPILIADVEDLIRSMDQYIQSGTLRRFDPGAHRTAAKKRVLVVDDSITVREVQRQILRSRGYEVEVAVDGMDGWNRLRGGSFDLVVSDVDMPRMTGLELVGRIRDDAKYRELPVVIVSYKDREEDRIRGMEAGANHYLVKSSFHDDSFADAVASLIGE